MTQSQERQKMNNNNIDPDQNKKEETKSDSELEQAIEAAVSAIKRYNVDSQGDASAFVYDSAHSALREIPMKSEKFRKIIGLLCISGDLGLVPRRSTVDRVIEHLTVLAEKSGNSEDLSPRIAFKDNKIYYDLGSKTVEISSKDWKTIDNRPGLFLTSKINAPQVTPTRDSDGSFSKFLDSVNHQSKQDRLLFGVWILSAFIPNISHPMLVLFGDQGTAKSTCMRLFTKIVDPLNAFDLNTKKLDDLVRIASRRWIVPIDNISSISQEMSDLLCRMVTGASIIKRSLYTDDDDFSRSLKRTLILNGINQPLERPDALDRAILISLRKIQKHERKTEETIWKNFEKELPKILGDIFSLLSKSISLANNRGTVSELPRMADFYQFAISAAEVLGATEGEFQQAFQHAEFDSYESAIDNSPVGQAIIMQIQKSRKNYLQDTAANLIVECWDGLRGTRYTPATFGRELNRIKPILEKLSYSVSYNRGTKRIYTIVYQGESNSETQRFPSLLSLPSGPSTTPTPQETSDNSDDYRAAYMPPQKLSTPPTDRI